MSFVLTRIILLNRADDLAIKPIAMQRQLGPQRRTQSARKLAIWTAIATTMASAHAVNGDTFSPYVGYTVTHDDNLLRLNSNASALATTGSEETSDTVATAIAGVKLDKQYLRQRVTADVHVGESRYDRYRQLNNSSNGYNANWTWHAFDDLEGSLISTYSHALAPFEDFRSPIKVMSTRRLNLFQARYLVTPSWRVRGDVSRYALSYELDALRPYDFTLNTAMVGIDFLPTTGSTFGLQAGRSNGSYPGRQASVAVQNGNYTLNEFKGLAKWKFTPKTDFQFLGGWVQRKSDTSAARDFSGLNARLTGNWAPTAKLNFSAMAFREFAATGDLASNYTLNRGLSVTSSWEMTYKIRLEATARTETRDYEGISTIVSSTAQSRNDRFHAIRLALVYQPTSHLKMIVGIFRNVADSNIAQLAYRANGATLNAQYEF